MMEKFAERYCVQNPGVFPNPDPAFVLAFSIIMLNTDLHNPAIREDRRMTKEQFISNNRGIASGGDLDPAFLGGIFDTIQSNQVGSERPAVTFVLDEIWLGRPVVPFWTRDMA
jgi:brefeldin A-inhibited guanine nucleotide-exchange protein